MNTPKFIIESDASIVAPLLFARVLGWQVLVRAPRGVSPHAFALAPVGFNFLPKSRHTA